jgi:predicted metal-dependent hydrolase
MTDTDLDSALRRGVELFNGAEFWHAHEAWEAPWLHAEGEMKQFLQGLIQLAAAYHHVGRGTYSGGIRLFDAALRRLEAFPPRYGGVDRDEAVVAANMHRRRIADSGRIDASEYPKLRYN